MEKTNGGKENRQQLHNSETNRVLEGTGRTKAGKRIGIILAAVVTFTTAATSVQAIELGGFDVDMGTGGFEEENSGWDQDSGTVGDMDYGDYDNTDDSWGSEENTWNDTMNSTAENTAQGEAGWEDSFSTGQSGNETSNSSYNSNFQENVMADGQAENTGISERTVRDSEIPEEQSFGEENLPEISSAPTMPPTATPEPVRRSASVTPASKPAQNILILPEKEEELPDEECRQKMQIIYCKKEIGKASKVKICPNLQLAAAILSVQVNGKEVAWRAVGGNIFLNMNEELEKSEIKTAVMCCRELSWTEMKKNAILTYTIF